MKIIFNYFALSLLFLLCICNLQGQSPKDNELIFRIQLGAYRNMALGNFDKLKLNELKGALYAEEIGNGVKRVFVGDYKQLDTAEKVLEKVKLAGFDGAFLISLDNARLKEIAESVKLLPTKEKEKENSPSANESVEAKGKTAEKPQPASVSDRAVPAPNNANPNTTPTTPVLPPSESASSAYVVQLGVFKVLDIKSFAKIADLGDIVIERVDSSSKVTIGTYRSRADAEKILSVVRTRGYNESFIKALP